MNAIDTTLGRHGTPMHAAAPGEPLVIDSFAGGGGASTGIEAALRRLKVMGMIPGADHVTFAINHDDAALAMHAANHEKTIHLPHDVWKVNLRELVGNNPVGLLWMSPDCRHHSRAKGGAPVSKSVRDLAWVGLKWLKELLPHQLPQTIFLENVTEFKDWGPLVRGADGKYRPCKNRKGQDFMKWVRALKRMGYDVEWREIRACDFGTPTIRNRLYLIARNDGLPIDWPAPTHGDPESEDVLSGRLQAWPVAADIVDWDRTCPSIFMTKEEGVQYRIETGTKVNRPLVDNTNLRIAKGVKRFVVEAAAPFLVTCNHTDSIFRGQGLDKPFVTVTRSRDAHGLVSPHLVSYYGEGAGSTDRSASIEEPVRTVTTEPRHALVETAFAPFVSYGQQGGSNRPVKKPLHTVTASRKDTDAIVVPSMVPFESAPVAAAMIEMYGHSDARPISDGLSTVTRRSKHALATATLAEVDDLRSGTSVAVYVKRDFGQSVGSPALAPVGTVTPNGQGKAGVVSAFMAQHNTDVIGRAADMPVSTIVGKGCTQNVVAAHMLSLKGSDRRASEATEPHGTICAGGQQSAVVQMPLVEDRGGLTPAQWAGARKVAEFLRENGCWNGGEIVTVGNHVIVDIGMRMLTARELARAQGLPEDYELAPMFGGKPLTDTEQRHKVGNSVCPPVAEALVFANYRPKVSMMGALDDYTPMREAA